MTTFVLMHGGGMGGWTWRYVAAPLRAAGHEVLTPTFTGFGERIHLLAADITNETHVTDILNVLHYEDVKDAVMVAHSYAGTVQPGVAAQSAERIARVVYLDAIVAHAGETVVSAMGMMPAEQIAGIAEAVRAGHAGPGSGVDAQQREMARQHPHQMPREREAWLLDHLSDMPLACTVNPIKVGAESLKNTVDYIAATDTVMTPMHSRAKALGWSFHQWEGDHALNVGQPERVVQFLLERT